MSQLVPYICEQLGGIQLSCKVDDGEPWFRAIDVATALKYTRTDQAIRMHMADDDKREQGSFDLHPLVLRGSKRQLENCKIYQRVWLILLNFRE